MYARLCKRPLSFSACCRSEASTSGVVATLDVPKPPPRVDQLRSAKIVPEHRIMGELERQLDEGHVKQQLEDRRIRAEVERLKKTVRARRWDRNVLEALETEGSTQNKNTVYSSRKSLETKETADSVTLSHLVAAQLHLGHSMSSLNHRLSHTSIYGVRHRQYPYIDLRQTLVQLRRAAMVVRDIVEDDGLVLFVSGKSLHPLDAKRRDIACRRAAEKLGRCGYSTTKWIGGSLSNTPMVLGRSEHSGLRTANVKKEDDTAWLDLNYGSPMPFNHMREFMDELVKETSEYEDEPLDDPNGGAAQGRLFKRIVEMAKDIMEERLAGLNDVEKFALFTKLNKDLRAPEVDVSKIEDGTENGFDIAELQAEEQEIATRILGKLREENVPVDELNELGFKPRLANPENKFTAWDFKPSLLVLLGPLSTMGYAVKEATQAGIPTIGIVDTDGDPRSVTWPIVGNAESTRGIELIAGILGKAGAEGRERKIAKRREFRGQNPTSEAYWYDQARREGRMGFEEDRLETEADEADEMDQLDQDPLPRKEVTFAEHFMAQQMKDLGIISANFGLEELREARELDIERLEGDGQESLRDRLPSSDELDVFRQQLKRASGLAKILKDAGATSGMEGNFEGLEKMKRELGIE